jgi:glycosyltransferase involved in cell wall biosynthesis
MRKNVNKKIAVLMTGPVLTDHPGGIQTHVQNFINAFSGSSQIDFRFSPTTLGEYDREAWPTKIFRFIRTLLPFGRAVHSVDVVHINSTFDNRSLIRDGVYLLIARWLLRTPVVLQFHGGLPKQVGLTRSALASKILGGLLGSANRILILSRIQGNEFLQLFPHLQYDLVPNYIECDWSTPQRPSSLEPIRFLFMGRLHENKGVKEIVIASHILAGKGYLFFVEFCGDGPLKSWLEAELSGPKMSSPFMIYNGVVFGKEKESTLARADVMLLPSSHPEGFPYTLLEAFKFGIPMISTPVGAIPDVVDDGKNGLLIPARESHALAAKMEYAIRNPDVIHAMGICARRQVEADFSFEKLRITFEGLYTATAGVK